MGMSADQLMELKENDEKAATDVFQDANCKTWMFKCRAKMDNFQDQQRYTPASPLFFFSFFFFFFSLFSNGRFAANDSTNDEKLG